jgi:hypothetical protein
LRCCLAALTSPALLLRAAGEGDAEIGDAPLISLSHADAPAPHPGRLRLQRLPSGDAASLGGASPPTLPRKQQQSVLIMGVGSDGNVWQWQLPLVRGLAEGPRQAPPLPPLTPADLIGEAACRCRRAV